SQFNWRKIVVRTKLPELGLNLTEQRRDLVRPSMRGHRLAKVCLQTHYSYCTRSTCNVIVRLASKNPSIGRAECSRLCILPIGNIELNENMEFASPPSTLRSSAQRTSRVRRRHAGSLQISSCSSAGESRASAPARRP